MYSQYSYSADNCEPTIPTPTGIRYPKSFAWKTDLCAVIDKTICAENFDLNEVHSRKVTYYDIPTIR